MKNTYTVAAFAVIAVLSSAVLADYDPFAAEVIDISLNSPNAPTYLPAPGQRVNQPVFNDASKALGAVSGGGTLTPNNDDVVTLGGFGGQVVLAFDHDVENSPANPMGLDAIVFTNALWIWGNPQLHFGELGTIEIMPELNGNSTPGDNPGEKWYVIPGTHLSGSSYRTQTWDETIGGYPAFTNWPDSYQTGAHELCPNYQTINSTAGILVNPNYEDADPDNDQQEGYYGYAEYTPTLKLGDRDGDNSDIGTGDCPDMAEELFYTTPDDPLVVGITPGSGGGDAFDIAWAVDRDTWQLAELDSFRYIRITTAVDERELGPEGILGEVSTEVDAAADIRPVGDLDGDGDVDIDDYSVFLAAWDSQWGEANFNPAADMAVDNEVDIDDYSQFLWGWNQYYSACEGMGCPPPPTPEPTSLLLLLMAAPAVIARRKRKLGNSSGN